MIKAFCVLAQNTIFEINPPCFMNDFFNSPVIWFIMGFVFFLLEFVFPGFILFFFGLGAWVVAVVLIFTDLTLNMQIVLFLGASVLSVMLLRKWLKQKFGMYTPPGRELPDEFIGKTAVAATPISPGRQGKVQFRGTTWNAASTDTITEGEEVTITGYESILLYVKSSKA